MDNKEFNKSLRIKNKQYMEIFGYIPCITDYACTREEYMEALNYSIANKHVLEFYIRKYVKPSSPESEI